MGWLFTQGATRADIIEDLTREQVTDERVFRTLRKCFRGNTMYALHESGKPGELKKWLCVYLLQTDGKYGWGYKDMDETMGPYYFDCPVSYLDEADPPTSETAAKWREEVRKLAAERASKKPKIGETWKLRLGCSPRQVRIKSLRPLRGEANGTLYKIKRRLLEAKVDA